MFKIQHQVYEKTPLIMKRMINYIPYSWIAGRVYRETLLLSQQLEYANRSEIQAFQEKKLGELLEYAVQTVPAYQQYRKIVEHYSPFEALKAFPLLSRQELQENHEKYISNSAHKIHHHEASTGGTTGKQLQFIQDDAIYAREMAFMHSLWKRVGYTTKSKKATFRGVKFFHIDDKTFWQENPIHNELQFSPMHMNESTLELYIKKMIEYQPRFIHGYPSAIDVLSEYIIRNNLTSKIPKITAALLGSEGCSTSQRERISNALNTKVYTWYGQSERVVLGGECEKSSFYHHFPGYGILELITDEGTFCGIGEKGEIVGTGFLNRCMPLIRYRTEDYAIRRESKCKCGRNWDIFSDVEGRWNIEGIIGYHGSRISAAALNMHGDLFKNVIRCQYYQKEKGKLEIRVIINSRFTNKDVDKIISEHNKKFHGEIDVILKIVNDIPLTKNGKHRWVICESR
jgi:phenylacetate-CoA ligase